jgi:hypothetical protein
MANGVDEMKKYKL